MPSANKLTKFLANWRAAQIIMDSWQKTRLDNALTNYLAHSHLQTVTTQGLPKTAHLTAPLPSTTYLPTPPTPIGNGIGRSNKPVTVVTTQWL